jgi:hypothetical protein
MNCLMAAKQVNKKLSKNWPLRGRFLWCLLRLF